ncbi:MAG: hypothetical protein HOV87_28565 [Catenulispora sp.]|nr:hypothetical protein [Catenulispora sp.]
MRIKRMAGSVVAGTLALAGLCVVGATAANAAVVNVSCDTPHTAELYGGPEQCFNYSGGGTHWIEVDGWGLLCASNDGYVLAVYYDGTEHKIEDGCRSGTIQHFYVSG